MVECMWQCQSMPKSDLLLVDITKLTKTKDGLEINLIKWLCVLQFEEDEVIWRINAPFWKFSFLSCWTLKMYATIKRRTHIGVWKDRHARRTLRFSPLTPVSTSLQHASHAQQICESCFKIPVFESSQCNSHASLNTLIIKGPLLIILELFWIVK